MPTWALHVIGNVGVVLILGAYFLLSTDRIKSISPWYQGLNLVGSIIMTAYTLALAAWAGVVLNATWAAIAVASLVVNLRRSRTAARVERSVPTAEEQSADVQGA